jgi:hypothetical protein
MIHRRHIFEVTKALQQFSVCWIETNGRKVFIDEALYINTYHTKKGKMMLKVKALKSGEIRQMDIDDIIELNGEEVFI